MIGLSVVVLTMIFRRWRHLLVFVGSFFFMVITGQWIYSGLSRPRPFGVPIISSWGGYSAPSPPVATLTIFLMGAVYCLVVPGRPRTYAKIVVAVVIALFCLARLYLAVDHPDDVLFGVALGVAIPVTAFRFFTPNEVFPVVYRRGKTAHVDVSGRRGEAIRQAVHDQLGLTVLEIKPVGLESSAGSTPLRLRVDGGPDEYLFAKLYTKGHVRADRWYKLWRSILYGSLEDESPFKTVLRLATYEDYALRLLQDIGVRTATPYGVVEITPEREYLLVTEFFAGAVEIGEADIDDEVIDQGLLLIRKLWDAGIAHRDIKPGNLMVRSGELLLIDVAFVQVRPSPWRQAVDLGNMMLVLAVRTDPDRVYQRALDYFTPDELAEAFAATRGVASPTQLRAFMKRDPRDLLAAFRALAPPRKPIVLQRWSIRRMGLACAVLGRHPHGCHDRRPGLPPGGEHRGLRSAVRHRSLDHPGGPGRPVGRAGAVCRGAPVGLAGGRRRHRQRARQVLAGLRSGRHAGGDHLPVRGLRRFRRPADPVRPAGNATIRAPAEPAPAVRGPALLHVPRWLRHVPVQVRARHVPAARDPGRRRGELRAPGHARGLRAEHGEPGVVRAGGAMSRVSRPAAGAGRNTRWWPPPGRDIAVTAVVLALTAVVFAAVADQGTLAHIQRIDDTWLRLMISSRSAPVTAVAMFLNVLGLVYITLPVRIAMAGFLALRRRWWHLAAFVAAVVTSEILIGTLKGVYDRARPPGSLVATSGASFPSGHSIAASVTVVAAVIALVPPGRQRGCVGHGRGGVLDPDGALARLPRRPLAVRRRRRGSARDVVRAAGRTGGRRAPAPLARAGRASRPAARQPAPGYRPHRGPAMSGHPVATPAGQLLPSSRYRHPGDVIRLIAGGTVLACAAIASAAASRWLHRPGRVRRGWPRARPGEPGTDRHRPGGVRGRGGLWWWPPRSATAGSGCWAGWPSARRGGRWPRPGSSTWSAARTRLR